jgi:hypothetical protein
MRTLVKFAGSLIASIYLGVILWMVWHMVMGAFDPILQALHQ